MTRKKLNPFLGLSILMVATASPVYAAATNFNCPHPAEIQSTDFTAPSIWVAPPVAHSVPGAAGVGLGGKNVKELLGAEPAMINHKNGWVCVYRSEGGMSVDEYQTKIKHIISSNRYLKKCLEQLYKIVDNAQPYLKNYPQNTPLGFVGYQKADIS